MSNTRDPRIASDQAPVVETSNLVQQMLEPFCKAVLELHQYRSKDNDLKTIATYSPPSLLPNTVQNEMLAVAAQREQHLQDFQANLKQVEKPLEALFSKSLQSMLQSFFSGYEEKLNAQEEALHILQAQFFAARDEWRKNWKSLDSILEANNANINAEAMSQINQTRNMFQDMNSRYEKEKAENIYFQNWTRQNLTDVNSRIKQINEVDKLTEDKIKELGINHIKLFQSLTSIKNEFKSMPSGSSSATTSSSLPSFNVMEAMSQIQKLRDSKDGLQSKVLTLEQKMEYLTQDLTKVSNLKAAATSAPNYKVDLDYIRDQLKETEMHMEKEVNMLKAQVTNQLKSSEASEWRELKEETVRHRVNLKKLDETLNQLEKKTMDYQDVKAKVIEAECKLSIQTKDQVECKLKLGELNQLLQQLSSNLQSIQQNLRNAPSTPSQPLTNSPMTATSLEKLSLEVQTLTEYLEPFKSTVLKPNFPTRMNKVMQDLHDWVIEYSPKKEEMNESIRYLQRHITDLLDRVHRIEATSNLLSTSHHR